MHYLLDNHYRLVQVKCTFPMVFQNIKHKHCAGIKPTSDSVEILLGSLTSPSSVEILESDNLSSRRESQHTDEFISPLESPEEISRFVLD